MYTGKVNDLYTVNTKDRKPRQYGRVMSSEGRLVVFGIGASTERLDVGASCTFDVTATDAGPRATNIQLAEPSATKE